MCSEQSNAFDMTFSKTFIEGLVTKHLEREMPACTVQPGSLTVANDNGDFKVTLVRSTGEERNVSG